MGCGQSLCLAQPPIVLETLHRMRFAESLTPASLQRLVGLFMLVDLQPHEIMWERGEFADAMYIVVEGRVDEQTIAERGEIVTHGEREMLGEEALLLEGDVLRSSVAISQTDCLVLRLPREAYKKVKKEEREAVARPGGADGTMHGSAAAATLRSGGEVGLLDALEEQVMAACNTRKTKLIQDVPFLKGVEKPMMYDLATRFVYRLVEEGEDIVREGEIGDEFFVISVGSAAVTKEKDGRDLHMLDFADGAYFGEIALVEEVPRTATVTATQDCGVLVLGRQHFHSFLETVPDARTHLLDMIRRRTMRFLRTTDVSLVQNLGDDSVSLISQVCKIRHVRAGEHVFEEGDTASSFFIVATGELEIVSSTKGIIRTLAEGDYFGELALVADAPRSATVSALTTAMLLEVPNLDFRRIMQIEPSVMAELEIRLLRARAPLRAVLAHPLGSKLFQEALEKDFSEENIHFWLATEWFRVTFHMVHRKRGGLGNAASKVKDRRGSNPSVRGSGGSVNLGLRRASHKRRNSGGPSGGRNSFGGEEMSYTHSVLPTSNSATGTSAAVGATRPGLPARGLGTKAASSRHFGREPAMEAAANAVRARNDSLAASAGMHAVESPDGASLVDIESSWYHIPETDTMRRLSEYMERNPSTTMRELVRKLLRENAAENKEQARYLLRRWDYRRAALQIFRSYISESAEQQVNLNATVRKRIEALVAEDRFPLTMYDEPQEEIYNLMLEPFNRFTSTTAFEDLLHEIKAFSDRDTKSDRDTIMRAHENIRRSVIPTEGKGRSIMQTMESPVSVHGERDPEAVSTKEVLLSDIAAAGAHDAMFLPASKPNSRHNSDARSAVGGNSPDSSRSRSLSRSGSLQVTVAAANAGNRDSTRRRTTKSKRRSSAFGRMSGLSSPLARRGSGSSSIEPTSDRANHINPTRPPRSEGRASSSDAPGTKEPFPERSTTSGVCGVTYNASTSDGPDDDDTAPGRANNHSSSSSDGNSNKNKNPVITCAAQDESPGQGTPATTAATSPVAAEATNADDSGDSGSTT